MNSRLGLLCLLGLMIGITVLLPLPFATGAEVTIDQGAGSGKQCVAVQNCFDPNALLSDIGQTVTWHNDDTVGHTVTSGNPSDPKTGTIFDSGTIESGGQFSFIFNNAGTFPYFCSVHPWMTGEVIVIGSSSTPTPVSPTPKSSPPPQLPPSRPSTPPPSSVLPLPSTNATVTNKTETSTTVTSTTVPSTTAATSSPQMAILSVHPTDQQGKGTTSFSKGTTGFAKVVLLSQSSQNVLIGVNLVGDDSTNLGVGTIKMPINAGQTQIVLSFFIPSDAANGQANIYADVFSDWLTNGGTPLIKERSSEVKIK